MKSFIEAAIVTAIVIEIKSQNFYRLMSLNVSDVRTKGVFELLAQEESGHLESFYDLYQFNDDELADLLNKDNIHTDPFYCSVLNMVDSNISETDALRIALDEERACIEKYNIFVETIREPDVRDIFVRILKETHNHCEMIEEEYMRLMHMVDRTDQDIYVRE